MSTLLCFFILFTFAIAEERESLLVQTAQGPIRGYKNIEDNVFEFFSIPYATTPTGVDRFKAPLPPPEWQKTFDAVDQEIICPQNFFLKAFPKSVKIQEDCLIANIFVPDENNKPFPVLVHVHGGAYIGGYGNLKSYANFAGSKNIVIVTFNYRLGAHGFLCLGTEDIPGNAGMKDQVALLRWVKKNIASFGGNPDEITISGGSAGSSAVELLMISKMTKGLFKRVIPESGASTAAFSIQPDPLQNAKDYAKLLNFDKVDDINALEEFYKTFPIDKLNSGDVWNRKDSMFLVSPCVEQKTKQESFLDDNPVNILRSGNYEKFPMLYDFAKMEGLVRLSNFEVWKDEMNKDFSQFLSGDLQFVNDTEKIEVANRVKKFYFGEKPVGSENILAYVDYFSDVIFTYPTLRSVKLHVESGNNNIYLYEYSYADENTFTIPYTNVHGVNHCAQSVAIVGCVMPGFPTVLSKQFLKMIETMRSIWHSFITTGYPTPPNSELPEWPPVGKNWSPHMSLNQTVELRGSLLKERAMFWEEIYDKYYRVPIPPPTPPPEQVKP